MRQWQNKKCAVILSPYLITVPVCLQSFVKNNYNHLPLHQQLDICLLKL